MLAIGCVLLGWAYLRRRRRKSTRPAVLPITLLALSCGFVRSASAQELHYGGKLDATVGRLRRDNTGVAEDALGVAVGGSARLELLRYLSVSADLLYTLLAANFGEDDRTELIKTFDFGVIAGVGVDVELPIGALTVDASYERGLTHIVDRGGTPPGAPYEYTRTAPFTRCSVTS